MLLVKYSNLNVDAFVQRYKDKVKYLKPTRTDSAQEWLIRFIEEVKSSNLDGHIILVDYLKELIMGFNALKIEYGVVFPQYLPKDISDDNKKECELLRLQAQKVKSYIVKPDETIENTLSREFDWITPDVAIESSLTTIKPKDRKQLTFKDLVENDNLEITDADIRDMKALTNKFKMAMLLQAKSRLKTVVKLCDVLDRLYEELLNRVDDSLSTTDTASLMYTAEYISKALNDVNQFIMPLINNEKLQNFFIIDNSSVINISDSRVDINRREKVRKAAEIVLDNIDYFTSGEYENIVNPNVVENTVEENKE